MRGAEGGGGGLVKRRDWLENGCGFFCLHLFSLPFFVPSLTLPLSLPSSSSSYTTLLPLDREREAEKSRNRNSLSDLA